MTLLKNGTAEKTEPEGLKALPFFTSYMKDNVKVIPFHIKSRVVQDLFPPQITFRKCFLNFYIENGKVSIKAALIIM